MGARLNVLGAIELLDANGRSVAVKGSAERAVLSLLALGRGQTVLTHHLIGAAWAPDVGPVAQRELPLVVERLRSALAEAGEGEIHAADNGYALVLPGDMLDVERAERVTPGEALELWRGEPLVEFAARAFDPERRRLATWRASLVEARGDELLAAKEYETVASQWETHLKANRLRPHLWRQFIQSLNALGKKDDALRAYSEAREAFASANLGMPDELAGLEGLIVADEVAVRAPSGDVVFLFTDVVGSTQLWEKDATAMASALADHDAAIMLAVTAHGGLVLKTKGEGDSTVSVFGHAVDALVAAAAAQQQLALPVRMAVHLGPVEARGGDYFGPTLNRAARLRATAHAGQVICSDAVHRAAGSVLPATLSLVDLGVHRLKDLAQPEQVWQLVGDGLATDFPPLASLSRTITNLPAQTSTFVGRAAELDRVREMLGASRLVTLTGAGGSGKTRLAVQVAAELFEQFPEGVWLAELASIAESATVATIVAAAVGAMATPNTSIVDNVVTAIGDRRMLVVLDNCEHVVDGAASVAAALLAQCPNLTMLATSRERLRVSGETAWPVPTLTMPTDDTDAERSEAVTLFRDRAIEADRRFVLDKENTAAVVAICRRVDAIPLAIELAAARVRVMAPAQLLARLEDHRDVLTRGDRTALPRQRSLRATIDWSYSLLSEVEQESLRRLAVFRAGWTLESAERFFESFDTIDILEGLVDKSLVVYDAGAGRYRMLETVREYGLVRLAEHAETDEWVRRYALEIGATADDIRQNLGDGPLQFVAGRRFFNERDNVTAAMTWAVANDRELAGRIVGNLWPLWHTLDRLGENHRWCREMRSFAGELSDEVAAAALTGAGTILGYSGARNRGIELLTMAVDAARRTGNRADLALALIFQSAVHRLYDEMAEAEVLVNEALTIDVSGDDVIVRGLVLFYAGLLPMDTGDAERANKLFIESYELSVRTDDSFIRANVLAFLPDSYAPAEQRFAELDGILQKLGDAMSATEVATAREFVIERSATDPNRFFETDGLEGGIAMLEHALAMPQVHYRRAVEMTMALAAAYQIMGRTPDALALLEPYLEPDATVTAIDRVLIVTRLVSLRRDSGDRAGAIAARDEAIDALRGAALPEKAYSYRHVREVAGDLLISAGPLEHDIDRAARVIAVGLALRADWPPHELDADISHVCNDIVPTLPPPPDTTAVADMDLAAAIAFAYEN